MKYWEILSRPTHRQSARKMNVSLTLFDQEFFLFKKATTDGADLEYVQAKVFPHKEIPDVLDGNWQEHALDFSVWPSDGRELIARLKSDLFATLANLFPVLSAHQKTD